MVNKFAGFHDHQKKAKFDPFLFFFWIILSCLWTCHVASAADNIGFTLKVGDTLNSSSALVSATGKFTLLFLRHDPSSNYSYLDIKRLDIRRQGANKANRAWVANRDSPVLYPFGVLTLDSNNTLKIITNNKVGGSGNDPPIVLASAPKSSTNVVATLLDTGNFVLQELNSDGSTKQVWWESFDYPIDTLLPGMKLGVNHSNGHIWSLTSWTSAYYPPAGDFTLDWDPNARQLEIRKEGVVYWRSGNYSATSNRFQNILPNAEVSYKFSIVSNENEDYLTYTSEGGVYYPEWVLQYDGRLFNFYGSRIAIARADMCRGNNIDGIGCQQTNGRPTTCTTDFGSPFELQKGYFREITASSTARCPYSLNFVSNGSYTSAGIDCKNVCLQNCDCLGFDFLFDTQTGCRFWSVDCEFIQDSTQPGNSSSFVLTKLMPSANSPSPVSAPRKPRATRKWIYIGVALGVSLVLMAFSIFCYLQQRKKSELSDEGKRNQNNFLNFRSIRRPTDLDRLQNDGKLGHDLSVFSYESVISATMNFADENKLGQGGFGPVYKGKLASGQEVAVKRLSKCSGQGILEFKNELILIYELQHSNLVQLFGFCSHGEERILIYEYVPNKSLDFFLFDPIRSVFLDWGTRFSIIEGIAQGLLYLHKFSRTRVIHRDLKASNVLLDGNMNPKISDFGMARIFSINELEANTERIVGTRGYMSPEYAMEGIFSTKSDVYSYGVLMLEIISGRRNNSFYNDARAINLVGYAWELWKEGEGTQLLDPTLADSCANKDQLLRCINIALLCVEDSAANRPTMSDVLSGLTNESSPLPAPTKPAFSKDRHAVTTSSVEEESHTLSVNDMTISDCDGR